ncbi:MAG: nucleotidyltransferase domain-containing protein [Cyclobacteriaceae bacterium]|nr:nucleotidyltransferase domain-containing protein [Cyclobacteriaceae bacterium]
MTEQTVLGNIKNVIHERDPKAEAFLFGSRARGDFKPDSDWDILILVDNPIVTNELDDWFRDKLYDIELDSGQIISTIIYSKSYWKNKLKYTPLYKNVTVEGLKL